MHKHNAPEKNKCKMKYFCLELNYVLYFEYKFIIKKRMREKKLLKYNLLNKKEFSRFSWHLSFFVDIVTIFQLPVNQLIAVIDNKLLELFLMLEHFYMVNV